MCRTKNGVKKKGYRGDGFMLADKTRELSRKGKEDLTDATRLLKRSEGLLKARNARVGSSGKEAEKLREEASWKLTR